MPKLEPQESKELLKSDLASFHPQVLQALRLSSLERYWVFILSKAEIKMTSRRSNNVKRTEWSMKCREKLSAHICKSHESSDQAFADES